MLHIKPLWNFANKGLLAILSLLVIFSLTSIVFLTNTLTHVKTLIDDSRPAIGSAFVLQDLMVHLQSQQSSIRGYALTGSPTFLDEYNEATRRTARDLETIKKSNRVQLTDKQRTDIVRRTEQVIASGARIGAIRAAEGDDVARSVAAEAVQGDAVRLKQLQQYVNDIASSRLMDIGPSLQQSQQNIRRSLIVAGALALFVLATCGAVIWYFQRAILRERALENTKSEFLSLASHQLRTPVTNVKQYVALILDGYMGEVNDKQRKALEVAYKNNEAEIAIMNNLLDVAKLDLNKIKLNKKPTDLVKMTRQIVESHKQQAAEREQTIMMRSQTEVVAAVDAEHIKGIVENLVDNAIKYSKNGRQIMVSVERRDDHAVIVVKDRGLGIRKRDFGKLFNKFVRLDNEFSANSEGSGLGLYWVKQIVALHNGRIKVVSREGKGSSFTVYLPIR